MKKKISRFISEQVSDQHGNVHRIMYEKRKRLI